MASIHSICARGLSPRVRGNPCIPCTDRSAFGSIPARAGEPRPPACQPCQPWVYPRACGGTSIEARNVRHDEGLSPRVRGNQALAEPVTFETGSIPARAGEPVRPGSRAELRRVYPRACGGTASRHHCRTSALGLSPRVRGNLRRLVLRGSQTGSIPARAGEPLIGNILVYLINYIKEQKISCADALLKTNDARVAVRYGRRFLSVARPDSTGRCRR